MKPLSQADEVCGLLILTSVLMPAVGAGLPLLIWPPLFLCFLGYASPADTLALAPPMVERFLTEFIAIVWTWHGFILICLVNLDVIAASTLLVVNIGKTIGGND